MHCCTDKCTFQPSQSRLLCHDWLIVCVLSNHWLYVNVNQNQTTGRLGAQDRVHLEWGAYLWTIHPNLFVFGLLEETRIPGGTKHGENM